MGPTSAVSTLSVSIPQGPTDVPVLKGSLEMALPAQVGENSEHVLAWFSGRLYMLSLFEENCS